MIYGIFSYFYDFMMRDIPYDEWEKYLMQLFYRFGVRPCGDITELGCGTGNMTGRLSFDGFNMTGIDNSAGMLDIARRKACENDISYILDDMRSFKTRNKQDAVLCVCDGMNYMRSVADMTAVMKASAEALKDGGVFIFDLKTEYFFKHSLDGKKYRGKYGNSECVWTNEYDDADRTHHYRLEFFREGRRLGSEEHLQHVFTAAEIMAAAKAAGFKHAAAYEAFGFSKPRRTSERIYIICG
ncbi:MAG: class I SAM-dependent methyltransferase [Lachnospiraceae bacterium]|nr:class I SAM-dependent methyltransferase [Lachnospiraceae bacterium]